MRRGSLGALFLIIALATLGPVVTGAEDGIRVPSSGVGTGVQDRELVGESDTFSEGDVVVFWTLVEGGAEGDSIDHVWIREGEEVVVVGLAVGSARWRTWSRKTMYPGSDGAWTVQARDRDGNVLAEATFTCTSPDR